MVMVLPSSVPASFSAPPLASRLRTCNSDFIDSKRALFSAVARSALPRGSRKLRAKPSFTRTVSPIWPSRPTRSNRITSIVVTPSCVLSSFETSNLRDAAARGEPCAQAEKHVGEAEQDQHQQRPAEHDDRGVDAAH